MCIYIYNVYVDIYGTFHPKTVEYTFFSSTHGTVFITDYMLGHKIIINKFKKTEIIPSIFSDHNGMKLEVSYKNNTGKDKNI